MDHCKENLTSDTFLVSTHMHSSEVLKISGPLNVYHTHTDECTAPSNARPPLTSTNTRPVTSTHTHTLYIRTHVYRIHCMYTLYVYAVVYAVYIHKGVMHSHTWSWIFVLETASVSLHSAPIHSNQPYPNVMQGMCLSSVKVQWHHSWISWGCLFLKYLLENCSWVFLHSRY